jgi:hypothetical protein
MKKRLVLVGCITVYVLIFVVRMIVNAWITRTWRIEQSIRVMPFMDALLQFLAPVVFYVAYRWGPTLKTTSPAEKSAQKYFYILASITFITFGLARLVNGLGQMSIISLLPALDTSIGIVCVGILPILAGFVLYQVITIRSERNDKQVS